MLDELHASNIALIEDATLSFAPGLTVLTGETGAGKTALLAALRLICGARADSSVIRDGADEALAEARIIDGDEHIVRRRLSDSGRSRCTIDGAMATVSELAAMTSSIEVHGQHEQVLLLQPARQLEYLDAWARDGLLLDQYKSARRAYLEAQARLDDLASAQGRNEQELEFMRFTCEQIEAVDPQEGEYEQLEEELPRLQHADQLAQSLQTACALLNDDGAALDMVAQACTELSHREGIDDDLDELSARLDALLQELEDVARDMRSYANSIDTDPGKLEETLGRLDQLSGIMKRFGPDMPHVFQAWSQARCALDTARDDPQRLDEAQRDVDEARKAYVAAAESLSKSRHAAASDFCENVARTVADLAMESAGFEFEFTELPFDRWGESGSEQVELLYRPAKTVKPRALRRIASGGELSRILLALESLHYQVLEPSLERSTIVFDEVDAGIGGATGSAVARKLASLSKYVQVIVVTHLAQVAAFADEHYVVDKRLNDAGIPVTTVESVSGDARVAEIARMLSGDDDQHALDHARSLLEGVAQL